MLALDGACGGLAGRAALVYGSEDLAALSSAYLADSEPERVQAPDR